MRSPKVSIIIPYYNRKSLLLHGLKSISKTSYKNIEVIIMDDASNEENRLEDLANNYWFHIKLIRIEEQQRWWDKDPAVITNLGFEAASGNILVLQQVECYYVGDVISHLANNIVDNNAITYACYGLNKRDTNLFLSGNSVERNNNIPVYPISSNNAIVSQNEMRMYNEEEKSHWWNHGVIILTHIPVCSAMTKSNWKKINYIDIDYKDGFGFSDQDFAERMSASSIVAEIVDEPYVLHLFHHRSVKKDYLGLDKNYEIYMKKHNIRNDYIKLRDQLEIFRSLYN
jgi:glycosyltransferase involved in cell wall biosynthesis